MTTEAIGALAVYLILAYALLNFVGKDSVRETAFAALNLAFCGVFFFKGPRFEWQPAALCAGMLAVCFLALRRSSDRQSLYPVALWLPVLFIGVARFGPVRGFVGVSYLAFRLSYLAFEVRSGRVAMPRLRNYLGFAVFPLTFIVGPISPYRLFERSLRIPDPSRTPVLRSASRLAVGAVKLLLFAPVLFPLTFSGMWSDGAHHGRLDLAVACISSYLHLYVSFSGACDLVIGAAGLLDFKVTENFDHPLYARNIRDFWKRFHISLTDYMRDIVYTPGLFWLSRLLDGRVVTATVLMLFLNFFLVGIWHGAGWNFVLLGLLHGAAMVAFYAYSLAVKGMPQRFRALADSAPAAFASHVLTFAFISATSLLFENDWKLIVKAFTIIYDHT